MTEETDFETAERLVRAYEANVAHQRQIVAERRRSGHAEGRAERLLASFELRLAQQRMQLAGLQRQDCC